MFVISKVNFKSKYLIISSGISTFIVFVWNSKATKTLNHWMLQFCWQRFLIMGPLGCIRFHSIFQYIKKFAFQIYVESTSKFACADQLKSLSKYSLSQFRLKSRVYQPHRLIHAKQIYFKVNILTFSHMYLDRSSLIESTHSFSFVFQKYESRYDPNWNSLKCATL